MNTLKNPLIVQEGLIANLVPFNANPGEYVSKELAEKMLEALKDYRDFLITGVSAIPVDDIIELILKAKG